MSELDAYNYELPADLIAQHPLPRRSDARLMVVDRGRQSIEHSHVRDLSGFLTPGDCLVVNDTRVVPARLVGHRTRTGGRWHGLFLSSDERGNWQVLSKTRGKLEPGETITLEDRRLFPGIELRMLAQLEAGIWAVRPEATEPVFELLEQYGRVPLPNYIRGGEMVDADRERYQTVFASRPGAVAAPTAGLHFTPELLASLGASGIEVCRVTLHVGIGTFRPVAVARLQDHTMHREHGAIEPVSVEALHRCRRAGRRIVAVGTTTVRVLETAALSGELCPWAGETDLFIRPPHQFRAVDALLTNFHLPKSTLLVLVRTFGGDALIRRAYEEAIAERYRFFSYGDAMLIL